MLGYSQSYTILYNGLDQMIRFGRMSARGENAKASPKEQITTVMNLSGKKTRAGRISGERCFAATKEESRKGKLSGSRTEISLF